jgi:excisionase family DNA binding protein
MHSTLVLPTVRGQVQRHGDAASLQQAGRPDFNDKLTILMAAADRVDAALVLDRIMACAAEDNEGDLLAQIEAHTTALTITQVAQIFGVSGETIRRMAGRKQIPAFRIGGSIRFNPASLGYWLRKRDLSAAKASKSRADSYQTEDYPSTHIERERGMRK